MVDRSERGQAGGCRDGKERTAAGHKGSSDGTGALAMKGGSLSAVVLRRPVRVKILDFDAGGQLVAEEIVEGFPDALLVREPAPLSALQARVHTVEMELSSQQTRKAATSPFLRAEEALSYVRSGKKRLRDWVRRGLLPETIDPDGRRFYRREDLDSVMGMGPVLPQPIAPTATPRRKEAGTRESWLHPVQPRTKPQDPERR